MYQAIYASINIVFYFLCRFISLCRVGTGLSDDELEAVVTKLKPYFR